MAKRIGALALLEMIRSAWDRRHVLVTGAGGFVGSSLCRGLINAGATVTAIIRDQPSESSFDLLDLKGKVNVVSGSITDDRTVQRAINEYEIEFVMHLAAQALVGAANRSPISTYESNVAGTWTVLEACRTSPGIRGVVAASSDKAYGRQPVLPYVETMPLLATNPYEASKAAAEVLCRTYAEFFRLPLAWTRCANIYGPGDVNPSRIIPATIRALLAGERPVLRSDGSPTRDYLFVDDAVSAYLVLGSAILADAPGVVSEAFNFGSGQPRSVAEVVSAIAREMDSALTPLIEGAGVPAGELDAQYLDSTKAMNRLSWHASTNFEDGLRRTIDWHRNHWS
jgi:CDP-glucose 4,6-dehydratase